MTFYDYFSEFVSSFIYFYGRYADSLLFELLFGFLLCAIVFVIVGVPFILFRKLIDVITGGNI